MLELGEQGLREVISWYSKDALYDSAWSEASDSHLVGVSGDGSIKLWDMRTSQKPVRHWQEHKAEVHSVDWNIHVRSHVDECIIRLVSNFS